MELQVKNVKDIVAKVNKYPELAKDIILSYGDSREERGIASGWRNCKLIFKRIRDKKKEKLKSQILEWDSENACLSMVELTEFITSIQDEIRKIQASSDNMEVIEALQCIDDFMFEKLSKDIVTDRRILFSRNYEKAKDFSESH